MLDKVENSNEIPTDAVSETFKVHALTVMPGLNLTFLYVKKNILLSRIINKEKK